VYGVVPIEAGSNYYLAILSTKSKGGLSSENAGVCMLNITAKSRLRLIIDNQTLALHNIFVDKKCENAQNVEYGR
jgi:hypothetical protein